MNPPLRLSPHFTLGEFTATAHREYLDEQGDPPASVLVTARRFCFDILEPARALVGPIRITSGYRCAGLNEEVGGASNSAHVEGRAADIVPMEMDLLDAYYVIAGSAIPHDQLIWEYGRWIHIAGPHLDVEPRREMLACFEPGVYVPFDSSDRRLV